MVTSGFVPARLASWRSFMGFVSAMVVMFSFARAADEAPATSAPAPAVEKILPVPIKQSAPAYPKKLQEAGITGTVLVSFVVNTRGDVEKVEALESPNEGLSAAAIEAVKQWKYKPCLLDGKPVAVRLRQTLSFGINTVAKPASR